MIPMMEIKTSEIHVWQLEQSDFKLSVLQSECLEWLTENENRRFQRYQFDRHRKQLLLGRVLLRVALSSYDHSLAPASWNFTYNEYGKPAISAEQNHGSIFFNLSHSAERVVLAASRFEPIGIDIECARNARRIEAIAQRYFSQQEVTALQGLPIDEQQARFYDLWTLKEAYIKACGMGLAIPLQHFSYGFVAQKGLSITFDAQRRDDANAWQLWQLGAGSEYRLALAARVGNSKPQHKLLAWRLAGLDQIIPEDVEILRSNAREP